MMSLLSLSSSRYPEDRECRRRTALLQGIDPSLAAGRPTHDTTIAGFNPNCVGEGSATCEQQQSLGIPPLYLRKHTR